MAQLTSDDRLAIQQVLHSYCHCVDRRRWNDFPQLFTKDCRLDLGDAGVFEGHDGLTRFMRMLDSAGARMRHMTANTSIHGSDERARAETHLLAIIVGDENRQVTGFYEDELVRHEGRWRILRRRAVLDL